MHWRIAVDYTEDLVIRTCELCGATGQCERCQIIKPWNGRQCRGTVIDGRCWWHDAPSCQAVTARGTTCNRKTWAGESETHCYQHRKQAYA